MEKEFGTYEQALALKDLGFDEPCMAIYYSKDKSFSWHHHKDHTNNEPVLDSGEFNISAPLYQQAFRWFREKYNLQAEMVFSEKPDRFYYYIGNMVTGDMERGTDMSYEEAEQACLDKLIEMIKNK